MKVHKTAGLTAVWRYMGNVDGHSYLRVGLFTKVVGGILGLLDPNSVQTIAQRTLSIDSFIKKLKPMHVIEIGAGLSSRARRFPGIEFYELDLPYFKKIKGETIPFEIGKDRLNEKLKLQSEKNIFVIEGVSMYLQKELLLDLLRQVKKYKGSILIDFFSAENSSRNKSPRERAFKFLFRRFIDKSPAFDFRIDNASHGRALLRGLGYKNVRHCKYKVKKTLDVLFYGEM